jgi:hypothetical protein
MEERIINYLIVKHIEDADFTAHPHCRVKSAYILAKKEYYAMSESEKKQIIEVLNRGNDDRDNKKPL